MLIRIVRQRVSVWTRHRSTIPLSYFHNLLLSGAGRVTTGNNADRNNKICGQNTKYFLVKTIFALNIHFWTIYSCYKSLVLREHYDLIYYSIICSGVLSGDPRCQNIAAGGRGENSISRLRLSHHSSSRASSLISIWQPADEDQSLCRMR